MDPAKVLRDENAAVGQMLLGRPQGEDQADWVTLYRTRLLESQEKAGFWKAGGQLPRQKRPNRETIETNTMWAILALKDYENSDTAVDKVVNKAMSWLGTKTEAKVVSTEWWVTRLMVERSLGNVTKADELQNTLLGLQNEDGGWGWLTADKSDAFGTGLVLYALAKEKFPMDNPKVFKAIKLLENSQQKDGAWEVNGTKKQEKDEPAETAKYWGTAWAVIGLLEFLGNG